MAVLCFSLYRPVYHTQYDYPLQPKVLSFISLLTGVGVGGGALSYAKWQGYATT